MNYENLPQPPEGVLNPKMPWSRINPNSRLWLILKSKLTGRRQGDESYTSYVNLSDADADRLIANIKKDPRGYPSLDQESGTPIEWMERQRIYQEWLVEAYLENPFREDVDKKIEEAEQQRRLQEIQEEKKKRKQEQEEREKRKQQVSPPTPVAPPVMPAAPAPTPEPVAPPAPAPAPPKPKPAPLRDEDLVAPRQMPSNVSQAMAKYGDALDAIGNQLSQQNSILNRNLGYLRRIDEDLGDVEFLLGQMSENYQEALDDFESEERKKEARKRFVAKLTSPFKRKEQTPKASTTTKPKEEKPWWNIWEKPKQKKLSSGGFLNTPYPTGLSRGGIGYQSNSKNIIKPGIYDNPTQGELAPGTAVIPLNRNYGKNILGQYDLQQYQQALGEVIHRSSNILLGSAVAVYGSVLRSLGPLAGYFNVSIPGLIPSVSSLLGISRSSVIEMFGGSEYAGLTKNNTDLKSFHKSWKDYMITNGLKFLGGILPGGKKKKIEIAGDILIIGANGEGLAGMGGTNVTKAPAWIPYSKTDSGKIYYISGFGKRWGKDHTGIDLAPAGSANLRIISPFVGKVSDVNRNWPADGGGGYGNYVEIQHDNPKVFLFYGHLKDVADSIQPGAKVSAGQVIGTTGTTGVSQGVHLHWEVRLGSRGQRIDPVAWTHDNKPGSVNPPKKNINDYPEYELDAYTQYDKGKIVRLGNKLYKINERGALGDEVPLQSGGWLKPLTNLVSRFVSKPKGLSIKNVQAGFTGMSAEGFKAIMGGDKFRLGKWKPQILGRGAYSAPTLKGAQRYAGSTGSLGGKQTPGGVVKSIVPGNARRINFLEPQAAVKPATFDKGKLLADKLLQGAYANSPLANKLRMQLLTGAAQNVGIGLGKLFGKAIGVLNAPVIGDMIFPEATAPGTLDYARSQGWVTPQATKPVVKSTTIQMPSSPSVSPAPQASSKPQFVNIDIPTNTVLTTTQMRRM